MAKLNDKQRRFVDEYLTDLNATQAAIRAGYSEKTAYSTGQRLLKNVEIQTGIQKRQQDRAHRTEITQDRVLQELAAIGFAKGTDYAKIVPGGVVELVLTDDLNETQKAALTGIKQTRDGVEIKLADKVKALELLGKHLGMFTGAAPDTEKDSNLFERLAESTGEEGDYAISEIQCPPEDDDDVVDEPGDV